MSLPRTVFPLFIPLLFLPLALAAPAAIADPAPPYTYWGVHAGQNDLDSLHVHAVYTAAAYDGTARLGRRPHVGVQLGRRTPHARYELEFETGRFDVKRLRVGPINAGVDARGRYQAAFANVFRVERLSDALDAFAGAGAGWGRTSLPHLKLPSACTCFGAASKDGFAWQLRAGLAFHVSPTSDVALQLTRLHLPGAETAGPPRVEYGHLGFNAWTLGWTSSF